MGLIAFCGFVLPWLGIGLWLYLTAIKSRPASAPWRPLTDYAAPGDGKRPEPALQPPAHEPATGPSAVTPIAGPATLADPEGAKLH